MGTKNLPGLFDCHAEAEPDEPIFTLKARDPLAAGIVELWADLRNHDYASAALVFGELASDYAANNADKKTSPEKIIEAYNVATQMNDWRRAKS